MPFGIKNNINFDEAYKNISKKIIEKGGYSVHRVDKINSTVDIDTKMYKSILAADIVVADISLYNPNVLYELGIRHSLINKTTKIIQKKDSNNDIMFDINHTTIFTYSNNLELLSSFILEKEVGKTDSIVRKNIDVPNHDFNSYKSLFSNWENNYDNFNIQIKEAKAKKEYNKILEITNNFELIFGNDFEPLVLEKALAKYKSNEEDVETLLIAKKMLQNLHPNFESSAELLGLISSINNRLLKFNLVKKDEAYEFVSKLYFSKKTPYTIGTYVMMHIELSLSGYFSKEYVIETISRVEKKFNCTDFFDDIEYVEDTKILIDYILGSVDNPKVNHATTRKNLDRIKEWKAKHD